MGRLKAIRGKKGAQACSIIGGADGPTSIFIAGKTKQSRKINIKQFYERKKYQKKRAKVVAGITANPHTLDEVKSYFTEKYRAKEVSVYSSQYKRQRTFCKTMLVQKYAPDLIGESLENQLPQDMDEEAIRAFFDRMKILDEKAASVSETIFPIDYHLYHIRYQEYGDIYIELELEHGYIGMSSSGEMKYVNEVIKDIYQYYGVTPEDIAGETERYNMLVTCLASMK